MLMKAFQDFLWHYENNQQMFPAQAKNLDPYFLSKPGPDPPPLVYSF